MSSKRQNHSIKNIWLIKEGETALPVMKNAKLMRIGALADYLSSNNYHVVWWSSGYLHGEKRYLYDTYSEIKINSNYELILLHSDIVYKKNTSLKRLVYHDILAKEFRKKAKMKGKPDIILCCYPTLPFAEEAIRYGKENGVPVILDARDQWPDIFERAFPQRFQKIVKVILQPMKREAAYVFRKADALCGTSPMMLRWALNYAKRPRKETDRVIFIGNEKEEIQPAVLKNELDKWGEQGVSDKTWNICLFSTLSKRAMDIDTAIDAIKLVHDKYPQIRFIIGGKGDDEQRLREYTKSMDFILMPGWLNSLQMCSLMSICKAGLTCYRNLDDMKNGWGNRIGQYLSYGLPILTSAEGISKRYVEQYGCGCAYKENDSKELANILFKLIEHPEEQEEMSKSAFRRFKMDFDEKIVVKKFEDMINDVYNQYYDQNK